MRNGRSTLAIVLLLTGIGTIDLSAHRRDELLQQALIDVRDDRVEIDLLLTPGAAMPGSSVEALTAQALSPSISLSVDGRPLRHAISVIAVPDPESLRRGEGIIRMRVRATLPSLTAGTHQLAFQNSHRPDISVYLANALVPSTDRIAIHAQRRDEAQVALAIDFTVRAQAEPASWLPAFGALAVAAALVGGLRLTAPAAA